MTTSVAERCNTDPVVFRWIKIARFLPRYRGHCRRKLCANVKLCLKEMTVFPGPNGCNANNFHFKIQRDAF